jgi:protocatechuate 3,4-dioxygenase beta subunit
MKRHVAFVLFLCLVPIICTSQTAVVPTLAGRIIDEDTGNPIAGAAVYYSYGTNLIQPDELSLFAGAPRRPSRNATGTTTDSEGRFHLQRIPPGSYRLLATAPGYVSREYGQVSLRRPGALISVGPADLKDLSIPLSRNSAVRGRVVNAQGIALEGITVGLARPAYTEDGARVVEAITNTRSDANGEFRFAEVSPGKYYLAAHASRPALVNPPTAPGEPSTAVYGLTFWPAADKAETAGIVEIRAGQEARAEIRMRGGPKLRTIRGRLEDPRTGTWPPKAFIRYDHEVIESGSSASGGGEGSYNPIDGTFELPNLEPGLYLIRATTVDLMAKPFTPPTRSMFHAVATAVVEDKDVESLVLRPWDLSLARGQVRVEGDPVGGANTTVDFSSVKVELQTASQGSFMGIGRPLEGQARPNGTLEFRERYPVVLANFPDAADAYVPGDYRAIIRSLPVGYYVAGIDLNGSDVTEKPFQLSTTAPNMINVRIRPGAAQLEITVRDLNGQPVYGADLALVPASQLNSVSRYRAGRSDHDGRFVASNLAPGEYQLFAWEGIAPRDYFDPELRAKSEAESTRFTVTAGQRITTNVVVAIDGR